MRQSTISLFPSRTCDNYFQFGQNITIFNAFHAWMVRVLPAFINKIFFFVVNKFNNKHFNQENYQKEKNPFGYIGDDYYIKQKTKASFTNIINK